ncbi:MAG: tetratricopeptide repeat protein [Chloroflexi bacterium]|nr:tetratricopeptide repeat protein [Chloroflexota bacterium]
MSTESSSMKMLELIREDAFEERLNSILDELSLGIKWERPSLLMVVYRSEHTKHEVQAILAKALEQLGQTVVFYTVDKAHYDIPIELLKHPAHRQSVFFVTGLRWGGGRGYSNAFRALNMHREYFIEGNIKAIFWLTKTEARQVARFSPDFWAFRHKVVEFLDLPSIKNVASLDSINSPLNKLYTKKTKDIQELINSAEMYYALGCFDEAILYFRKALRAHPNEATLCLRIAEIYLCMGRFHVVSQVLKKAAKIKTKNPETLRALHRLTQTARLVQQTSGGFSEQ